MIFFIALRKELLEQWYSYRLLIVTVVLLFFGLTSPLLAKLTPEIVRLVPNGEQLAGIIPPPTVADAVAQYIKNMGQFGVVIALLMTMGAVAQEKDKGTAALMLVKPLPRGVFLGAKLAALALTFAVSISLAGVACYYYTLVLFDGLDIARWLAVNGLMLLFVLVYVALTLLCSTLTDSLVAAGGLAFALMVVLVGASALPVVNEYLPGQLLAWGAELMAGTSTVYWPALGVSTGIILGAFIGAWAILQRQEI